MTNEWRILAEDKGRQDRSDEIQLDMTQVA
jgi:hypothetical protein